MAANILAKPMRPFAGYRKWERIQRPVGPSNLGKALSACVVKLRELRELDERGEQDENEPVRDRYGKSDQQSRDLNRSVGKNTRDPASGRSEALSDMGNIHNAHPRETAEHNATNKPIKSHLPTRPQISATSTKDVSNDHSKEWSSLGVLVVEDNAVNRKLLGAFLTKYGCHNVYYAENGALAVKAVEGRPEGFDVIFMDLSMPVMDGFIATREIRRIERERPLDSTTLAYIVALTGLASDRDEDQALAAGVNMFITKPVRFDKLSAVLRQREGPSMAR
jgi:CheY-like chemotaxis protein